jgi:hypothetical protein
VVLPPDLLVAMGLTVATDGTARFISARNDDPSSPGRRSTHQEGGWRYLYLDDQDRVNFGKLQLLSWTLVAVGLFLITVTSAAAGTPGAADLITTPDGAATLPDLGVALVLLQGLGTATYLGDKMVTTTVAHIADVKPRLIEPGGARLVSITGTGFGGQQEATLVLLDGEPQVASSWSDTRIEFTIAAAKASSAPYPTDRDLELRVGGATPWIIRIATDPAVTGIAPTGDISISNPVQGTITGPTSGTPPARSGCPPRRSPPMPGARRRSCSHCPRPRRTARRGHRARSTSPSSAPIAAASSCREGCCSWRDGTPAADIRAGIPRRRLPRTIGWSGPGSCHRPIGG